MKIIIFSETDCIQVGFYDIAFIFVIVSFEICICSYSERTLLNFLSIRPAYIQFLNFFTSSWQSVFSLDQLGMVLVVSPSVLLRILLLEPGLHLDSRFLITYVFYGLLVSLRQISRNMFGN